MDCFFSTPRDEETQTFARQRVRIVSAPGPHRARAREQNATRPVRGSVPSSTFRVACRSIGCAIESHRRIFSYTHAHNASVLLLPRVRTAREPAKQNATRPVLGDLPSSTCRRWRVGDLRSIDRTNERSSFVTPPASNSTTLRRSRCRHAFRPRMSPRRWCSAKPAIPARRRAG